MYKWVTWKFFILCFWFLGSSCQGWVQEEKSRSIPESSLASQTLLTMSGSSPPLLFQTVIKLYCVTHSTDVRCEREVINDVGFTRQFIKVRVLLLFRCFISENVVMLLFYLQLWFHTVWLVRIQWFLTVAVMEASI